MKRNTKRSEILAQKIRRSRALSIQKKEKNPHRLQESSVVLFKDNVMRKTAHMIYEQTLDKYRRMGTYFGYPSCCIHYFSERTIRLLTGVELEYFYQLSPAQQQLANLSGYIMCPECVKYFQMDSDARSARPFLLDIDAVACFLQKSRKCPTIFPIDEESITSQDVNLIEKAKQKIRYTIDRIMYPEKYNKKNTKPC